MRAYISILRIRFLILMQYRMAAIAGMTTQLFFGFVRVMVFYAFYSGATGEQPLSYEQTIAYIWLGQAMLGMLPWNGDGEIQEMIRSGNVAYEFCRPISVCNQWLSRAVALRSAPTLLRALPIFLIAMFLLPEKYALSAPHSVGAAVAWFLSTLAALLLSAVITNIINISTLWTISGEGLARLLPAVVTILSGMIVPLPLFPDWMQRILRILPFSSLVDVPMRFYTGHLPAGQLPVYLLTQILWSVAIYYLGILMFRVKMKDIVVQGG